MKIKKPKCSPIELDSNIAYGMTSVNNITQDELDSVKWLCELKKWKEYIAKSEGNIKSEQEYKKLLKELKLCKKEMALWKRACQLACEKISIVQKITTLDLDRYEKTEEYFYDIARRDIE